MTAEEAIEAGILQVKLPEGTEVRPVCDTVVDRNKVVDYTVESESTS